MRENGFTMNPPNSRTPTAWPRYHAKQLDFEPLSAPHSYVSSISTGKKANHGKPLPSQLTHAIHLKSAFIVAESLHFCCLVDSWDPPQRCDMQKRVQGGWKASEWKWNMSRLRTLWDMGVESLKHEDIHGYAYIYLSISIYLSIYLSI